MKKLISTLIAATLGMGAVSLQATEQQLIEEARGAAMQLGKNLQMTLKGAMKEGGPVTAVKACNTSAPGIADQVSSDTQWQVGRTSLKIRNPGNAPDAWETGVLEDFEARKAAGEDPKKLEYSEVVMVDGKKTFRYMKAIPTAEVCMNCHGGEEVKPAIEAILKQHYPEDVARGYKPGDLRGAFTLSKTL